LFLFISCCFCLPTTNEKFFYHIETFTRDTTSIFFSSLLCSTWSYCSTISIFYRAINIPLQKHTKNYKTLEHLHKFMN